MIIKATKLNFEIIGAAACDSIVMDQLIDGLIKIAEANFSLADQGQAWTFVDENGILSYLAAFGWNISIS